jgi:hypothetical protein
MEGLLMSLNVKSFLVIGLTAVIFIVVAKVLVNKYPVKGLTDIVNAV